MATNPVILRRRRPQVTPPAPTPWLTREQLLGNSPEFSEQAQVNINRAAGNIADYTPTGSSSRKNIYVDKPKSDPLAALRWVNKGTSPDGTKDNSAAVSAYGRYTNQLPWATQDRLQEQIDITTWKKKAGVTYAERGDLPTPTVATKENPVILRQKKQETIWYKPVPMDDIESMDLKQLKDFQRSLQFDQMSGRQLTKEEFLKLQRAADRAMELAAPQSTVATTAIDELIGTSQQEKTQAQQQIEAQNEQQLQATRDLETEKLRFIREENAKAEEKQRNTLWYVLGAQWAGTSSYGAEKLNEITSYFNQQNKLAILESTANIEKLRAEQAGATREELAKYDERIFALQDAKAKYVTQAAMKVDEYNQAQAQSTEKSLQNILDVAMAQEASKIPFSDLEKQQIEAFWQLLIDADGKINKDILDQIPARLKNAALIAWSVVKGAIPREPKTVNTDWGTFVYDYATQTWKKLAWSEKEKEASWTQLDDGRLMNAKTGEIRNITSDGTIQSAIQTAVEKCKDWAQCGKFVNDVLQSAGLPRLIQNSYDSKVKAIQTIGEAMTAEDIGAGSVFAYPVDKSIDPNWYWHIGIVTGINADGTINIMDYNYRWDQKQRERMNVDPSEILNMGGSISKPIITNENVPQATKPLTDKQFTQSNQVITSFKSDLQVKAFEEAYSNGLNLLSSLNDESWPWDVSAIFQFMKTLDPQSVVREAEFETAAKSAGVWEQFKNIPANKLEGAILTSDQRKAFGKLAKQFIKNKATVYQTKYDDGIRRLEKQGIDTSVFPTNIANEIDQYLGWETTQSNDDPLWLGI